MKRHSRPLLAGLFITGLVLLLRPTAPLLLGAPAPQKPAAPTRAALVGIWKECYDPALKVVLEIDSGYLTLSPDGTFLRWSADQEGELVLSGTWHATDRSVHFEPTRGYQLVKGEAEYTNNPGPLKGWTLIYESQRSVALFDSPRKPGTYPVLLWNNNLNYSFAKVY